MSYQTSPLLPDHLEGTHTQKLCLKDTSMRLKQLAREHDSDLLYVNQTKCGGLSSVVSVGLPFIPNDQFPNLISYHGDLGDDNLLSFHMCFPLELM